MRPEHLHMIPLRLYVYGIAAAAVLALSAAVWVAGYRHGAASKQAAWDAAARDSQIAWGVREAKYRADLQAWQDKTQEIGDAAHRQLADVEAERDQRIAAIGTDNQRLRERFRSCAASQRVPAAGETVSRSDGARQGGLSPADEEFLVRIAAECDATAVRLTALQTYVANVCGASQ